jgi:spore coat polysaccharide biosynthesis protein SpsF (cytidylyltransferase family)
MKPILKEDLAEGTIINLERDFIYRRSSKEGLGVKEIEQLLTDKHVLSRNVTKGKVLVNEDFRKAKIGVVVVCRMKSTRLPGKALLKIGTLTSVEYCIKNVLKLEDVNTVILATSTHPDDEALKNYTYSKEVEFYRGDPIDVMQRMVDVVEKYDLDIVSRVTADMLFIPHEIYQEGLKMHFLNGGTDYTRIEKAPIGVATSIITAKALIKAKKLFPSAKFSEYLPYYFLNNPSTFNIQKIDITERFQRNFRLTLDYKEDLLLFREIDKYLTEKGNDGDFDVILKFLDNNPDIASINQDLIVKYLDQKELIDEINKNTTIKTN